VGQGRNRENRKRPNRRSRYNGITTKLIASNNKSRLRTPHTKPARQSRDTNNPCQPNDQQKPTARETAIEANAVMVKLGFFIASSQIPCYQARPSNILATVTSIP